MRVQHKPSAEPALAILSILSDPKHGDKKTRPLQALLKMEPSCPQDRSLKGEIPNGGKHAGL
jgi:hypothetical protein